MYYVSLNRFCWVAENAATARSHLQPWIKNYIWRIKFGIFVGRSHTSPGVRLELQYPIHGGIWNANCKLCFATAAWRSQKCDIRCGSDDYKLGRHIWPTRILPNKANSNKIRNLIIIILMWISIYTISLQMRLTAEHVATSKLRFILHFIRVECGLEFACSMKMERREQEKLQMQW